ncbi:MAG: TerB family tellurite resistance protein [Candidatus Cloacimonetes bacterium]|nr:TerB family tellurite resistance protein [Candidatus Cloacimonadota bacterium]MCF7814686.1 TerB family tellurite resistance protein [Candidatus Cloacimonadota bacterium]MCF7868248.1 TerB family tellurite resistance protein [Candidatus Cloacimonadota bacterium]MCF7883681.1 TerB family tellurite resistance protein [Candidatus Cloacimonadota bacterium]
MSEFKTLEYYVNDDYSFEIKRNEKGQKIGRLVSLETDQQMGPELVQKVIPENIKNLVNVAKVVISAAWQDGKILQSEKDAFNKVFEHVDVSEEQEAEIKNELVNPTPIEELVKNIRTREEKMLILETSLLLIIADNEFHPKEKAFIEYLVKEFKLDKTDFAILYNVLPEEVRKYIVKESITDTLAIKADEIEMLTQFAEKSEVKDVNHEKVYSSFLNNWKDRSNRYRRISSY